MLKEESHGYGANRTARRDDRVGTLYVRHLWLPGDPRCADAGRDRGLPGGIAARPRAFPAGRMAAAWPPVRERAGDRAADRPPGDSAQGARADGRLLHSSERLV